MSPPGAEGSRNAVVLSELLTEQEAADRLRVPVRMVRRLRAERELPFVKIGKYVRIRQEDLRAFCDDRVVEIQDHSNSHTAVVQSARRSGHLRKERG